MRTITPLLRVRDKWALWTLVRSMRGQLRLLTASALLRSGVTTQLAKPSTAEEIGEALGLVELDLLRHLLGLGVRTRLLKRAKDQYAARGALARCLVREGEGPLASMLQEVTTYHQDVFRHLPPRLRGEAPRDYLAEHGSLVARSSRIMDPWIQGFTREVVGEGPGKSLLDLGCGSGAFLSFTATLHPAHHGIGLELDAEAATAAADHLLDSGCADRFEVRQGDVRREDAWPNGKFDVVTAHQNVYYFTAEERREVWSRARKRLNSKGCVALVTPTAGGPLADYFSLILLSTRGCQPLPTIDELESELHAAGFARVHKQRLIPGDAVWGIEASSS